MKIVDRYIFQKFIRFLILCYISLVGLFAMLSVFSNLDAFFSDHCRQSPFILIPLYYFFKSFVFIDQIFPLLILFSAMACMSTMLGNNEIIALMSMGVSQVRTIMPIVFTAFILTLGVSLMREIYIPDHMLEMVQSPTEFVGTENYVPVNVTSDRYTEIEISGDAIYPDEKRISKPVFNLMESVLSPQLSEENFLLKGENAYYQPMNSEHPEGYLVTDLFMGQDILSEGSLCADEWGTIIYSPVDHSWLKEGECFVSCQVGLDFLMAGDFWISYSSLPGLINGLRNPALNVDKTKVLIAINTRIIRPFTDIIPLFLGLPILFTQKERKSKKGRFFAAIMQGAVLGSLYIGVQYLSTFIGSQYDAPVFAAFLPAMIFVPIATNIFSRMLK